MKQGKGRGDGDHGDVAGALVQRLRRKKNPPRRCSLGGLMSLPAPRPPTLHPPFAQERPLSSSSLFFFLLFAEKAPNSFPHHPCPETPGAARLHDFYEGRGEGRFVRGERGIHLTNRRLTCPPFIQPPSNSSKACINPPNPA